LSLLLTPLFCLPVFADSVAAPQDARSNPAGSEPLIKSEGASNTAGKNAGPDPATSTPELGGEQKDKPQAAEAAAGPAVAAPSWRLPDVNGKTIALEDYRGKPVLLILYLGAGCPHCIEQLDTFGPKTREFAEAGINIVGMSTESAPELRNTFATAKNKLSFPIVADEKLETFKAYGAFNPFSKKPMHGTYLIDGAGQILWQETGSEPFLDADWLLKEGPRLLAPRSAAVK
jgi:peroxiredoxin